MNRVVKKEELMALHAAGLNDCQIAALLGVRPAAIVRRRKRLGLRCNFVPGKPVEAAASNARQRAALARTYSLPAMPERAVAALLCLLDGPLTRKELRAKVGGSDGYLKDTLSFLRQKGLVGTRRVGVGTTTRARRAVYSLTLKAMEVIGGGAASE